MEEGSLRRRIRRQISAAAYGQRSGFAFCLLHHVGAYAEQWLHLQGGYQNLEGDREVGYRPGSPHLRLLGWRQIHDYGVHRQPGRTVRLGDSERRDRQDRSPYCRSRWHARPRRGTGKLGRHEVLAQYFGVTERFVIPVGGKAADGLYDGKIIKKLKDEHEYSKNNREYKSLGKALDCLPVAAGGGGPAGGGAGARGRRAG